MPANEPKSFEQLFHELFGPNPYPQDQKPAGPSYGYGTTTNTATPNVKPAHPHDEAVRVLKDAEAAAKEIALPEVRSDRLLQIAHTYQNM